MISHDALRNRQLLVLDEFKETVNLNQEPTHNVRISPILRFVFLKIEEAPPAVIILNFLAAPVDTAMMERIPDRNKSDEETS
jgi:hypothetical protein